jgi:hypothetical protein
MSSIDKVFIPILLDGRVDKEPFNDIRAKDADDELESLYETAGTIYTCIRITKDDVQLI